MMNTKFSSQKFDGGTMLKLEIIREYVKTWIPVWLSKHNADIVRIYDFFAGTGGDKNGNEGSPIVILQEIYKYYAAESTPKTQVPIKVLFSDKKTSNIENLKEKVDSFLLKNGKLPNLEISFENGIFDDVFDRKLPEIQHRGSAKLLLLDQFGIKDVSTNRLSCVGSCLKTDVLFFVASNYVHRFKNHPNIQKFFSPENIELFRNSNHNDCHRIMCECIRKAVPQLGNIAPFSIQKEKGNIYGLIFGSNSLLGLEKFLEVCWKKDTLTGEANFNIDDDISRKFPCQGLLFEEDRVVKKRGQFESNLEEFIAKREPNNLEIYEFCLKEGFLPKDATKKLKELEDNSKLICQQVGDKERKRHSFYVNWDEYNSHRPRFIYKLHEKGNV